MNEAVRVALERVPDEPIWVDTRGMLITGRATAVVDESGLVVSLASRALVSVAGAPAPRVIHAAVAALQGDVNVLCQLDSAGHVREALPSWKERRAVLHVLPGVMDWEQGPDAAAIYEGGRAPNLDHVDDPLRSELMDALGGRPASRFVSGALPPIEAEPQQTSVPLAVVMADGRAVAFCYPVLQTESLWDVSVDTLPGYRGRGLAVEAARTMIRYMRRRGRAPVWGTLDTNAASLSAARRGGFVECGRIAVFSQA